MTKFVVGYINHNGTGKVRLGELNKDGQETENVSEKEEQPVDGRLVASASGQVVYVTGSDEDEHGAGSGKPKDPPKKKD